MAQDMDTGDQVMEKTIPSLIKEALDAAQNIVSSPEDIAWVDSCLIKESDISNDNWNSLKAALVEIIDFQSVSLNSSSRLSNKLHGENDIEILNSSEETEPERFSRTTRHSLLAIREELETPHDDISIKNDIPVGEDANYGQSFTFEGNPFLPGYNNEAELTENHELGVSNCSWASEIEPSTEDIFRVWNLDVPVEEDVLVEQLNNAIKEGLPPFLPSSFSESDMWKNLDGTSLDDLASGIANLSLNQNLS